MFRRTGTEPSHQNYDDKMSLGPGHNPGPLESGPTLYQ